VRIKKATKRKKGEKGHPRGKGATRNMGKEKKSNAEILSRKNAHQRKAQLEKETAGVPSKKKRKNAIQRLTKGGGALVKDKGGRSMQR